ncbi:MAG: glutathione S-transferase family protein [Burkholderiales bacterium]|nr:glutathione S-transferase family protein [Burkholderiales bacterium]
MTPAAGNTPLVLVSHVLCPYVQRAAIVLAEKGVPFERRDVDLARKPEWFLRLSPLGKTPVLQVGGAAIFESAVICEYLDETNGAPMLPAAPLARARQRAWVEFASQVLNGIAAFYGAADEAALQQRARELRARFEQLELVLGDGPWFAGERFGLVDAAFAPVFRYFDVFDALGDFGFWPGLPKVQAWRQALAARPSVAQAAAPAYPALLRDFLRRRGSALSGRVEAAAAA